jgi:hypothetical protein
MGVKCGPANAFNCLCFPSAQPGCLGHAGQTVLRGEDDQGLGHRLLHTPAVCQANGEQFLRGGGGGSLCLDKVYFI